MSFTSNLATFKGTARSISRDFSGGMYDSLNQMFTDTSGLLTTFSLALPKISAAFDALEKQFQTLMPDGVSGIEEDLRNFDRSIGWTKGTWVASGGPMSLDTASGLPASATSVSSLTPTVPSGSSGASHLGATRGSTGSSSVVAASSPAKSPKSPSGSSLAVRTTTFVSSPTMSTSPSPLAKQYAEWRTYLSRMFQALNICGNALVVSKAVSGELDIFFQNLQELNALLSKKFDVTEFNRQATEISKLFSAAQKTKTDLEDSEKSLGQFQAVLNEIRHNIRQAQQHLSWAVSKLKWKPGWIKKRENNLLACESAFNSYIADANIAMGPFASYKRRLNAIMKAVSQKNNLLATEKNKEESRQNKIRIKLSNCTNALGEAKNAHLGLVPASKLNFKLVQSGNQYVGSPSKADVIKEINSLFNLCLKEMNAAAIQLTSLQKATEKLTEADINTTSTYPTFCIVDSCMFSLGGSTFVFPIPTSFPFTKARRFADASELTPFLLRLLCAMPVGSVQITIADQAAMGRNGSVFNGLQSSFGVFKLVAYMDDLHSALKEHSAYIADLASSGKFGATDKDWWEYNAHHPKNPLPCKIFAIYSFRGWDWQDVDELENLIAGGPNAGVYVLFAEDGIAELDDRMRNKIESWPVALNPVNVAKWAQKGMALSPQHIPMQFPSNAVVDQICKTYIGCLTKHSATSAHVFDDLFDRVPQWSASSIDGLKATIGWDTSGNPVSLRINDDNPHVLIGGKSGGGKSNLIHVIISSLCHRYSPEELQICLLDMKDGVEVFRYLDEVSKKAWLPHARAILASDSPHFAAAYLDEIGRERLRRNAQFRSDGAGDLASWRTKTGRKMPRMLIIADEFTRMFGDSDISKSTSEKLADMLTLGRSCGIHVVLATQTTDSLTTANASVILSQTTVRLALPEARGVLAHGNTASDTLKKPFCILNEFSGADGKNLLFEHPYYNSKTAPTDTEKYRRKQISALAKLSFAMPACRVVDGVSLHPVPALRDFQTMLGPAPAGARPRFNLLLGRTDDFDAQPFLLTLSGDTHIDNLMIVSPKDPEGREGVWDGLWQSIKQSLALLPSHRVLYYDPSHEHLESMPAGFEALGADADEDSLKKKLEDLRSSTEKHRVFIVENFEQATFLARDEDNPFGPVDEDSTFGVFNTAFERKKRAFAVILFTRNPDLAEEMLGDKGWKSMSHRIAFGMENTNALREVIKGTEMLDKPGRSIYYNGPTTGGGFRTLLPFVSLTKRGRP